MMVLTVSTDEQSKKTGIAGFREPPSSNSEFHSRAATSLTDIPNTKGVVGRLR